jgi:hypothetical protein
MTDTYTYRVANLSFSVTFDADDALKERMEPYAPFQTDATDDTIFTIQALAPAVSAKPSLDGCELVVDTTDVGLLMRVYRSAEGAYIVLMSTDTDKDGWCYVHIDNHFTEATLASCGKLSTRSYGLTNALMMLFAFAGATRRTLLFHASVIKERGRGFLFLGKSGTGKSTHSALWLKHIAGTELLNDDNPAVQISPDGTPMVYGTPWSGKTPCYKNDCAPIGGLRAIVAGTEKRHRSAVVRSGLCRTFTHSVVHAVGTFAGRWRERHAWRSHQPCSRVQSALPARRRGSAYESSSVGGGMPWMS